MKHFSHWFTIGLILLGSGCGSGSGAVATSNPQLVEQFRVALDGLEQAIGRPRTADDAEDYSDDLTSRLDKLGGIANELEFATANKSDALEVVRSISATLTDLQQSAERNPRADELRTKLQKLKTQVDELKQKI